MSSEECGQMIVKISVISVKLELNSQLGEDSTRVARYDPKIKIILVYLTKLLINPLFSFNWL